MRSDKTHNTLVGGEQRRKSHISKISNSNCVELIFTVTIAKISTRETSFDEFASSIASRGFANALDQLTTSSC